jgi:hypothetical protein
VGRNPNEKHKTYLSKDRSFRYALPIEAFSFFLLCVFFVIQCSLSGSLVTLIYIYTQYASAYVEEKTE